MKLQQTAKHFSWWLETIAEQTKNRLSFPTTSSYLLKNTYQASLWMIWSTGHSHTSFRNSEDVSAFSFGIRFACQSLCSWTGPFLCYIYLFSKLSLPEALSYHLSKYIIYIHDQLEPCTSHYDGCIDQSIADMSIRKHQIIYLILWSRGQTSFISFLAVNLSKVQEKPFQFFLNSITVNEREMVFTLFTVCTTLSLVFVTAIFVDMLEHMSRK